MATIKIADSQHSVNKNRNIWKTFRVSVWIFTIYSWEDTLCNKLKKLSSLFKIADFQNGRFEA